jgi:Transposase DDE domain
VSGSRGARGKPDRRDHRQPKRQERGKRGRRIDPSGYDAGKKINGKKRHILVDTQGLLMRAIVHAADVQDRDGVRLLMATLFGAFPFLTGSSLMAVIRGRNLTAQSDGSLQP